MKSVKEIYKIGHGPSSSHTMGPRKAAAIFKERFAGAAASYKVTLYGSLALTGRGHLTDAAIIDELKPFACEVVFKEDELLPMHTNGMYFEALDNTGAAAGSWRVYSVGGGDLADGEGTFKAGADIYPMSRLTDILEWADKNGRLLSDYVEENEDGSLLEHLGRAWEAMKKSIARGLEAEGRLPGGLSLARKAYSYHLKANNSSEILQKLNLLFAYALAVSEENAAGGLVVTAPTCGSAGVMPSVLYLLKKTYNFNDAKIVKAMATAGLIGNIAKFNASVSGAEVGCQGEVGVACAMAAAAAAKLLGGTIYQVEYAAEMGLEHHLGLTCDPILGLVQIPCIERNAMAAARAFECAAFALNSDGKHRISYDEVVDTMGATGRDMKDGYRETAKCGLAREWNLRKK
jgi:L-serine dehydratase